jgi:hypothetical protein
MLQTLVSLRLRVNLMVRDAQHICLDAATCCLDAGVFATRNAYSLVNLRICCSLLRCITPAQLAVRPFRFSLFNAASQLLVIQACCSGQSICKQTTRLMTPMVKMWCTTSSLLQQQQSIQLHVLLYVGCLLVLVFLNTYKLGTNYNASICLSDRTNELPSC